MSSAWITSVCLISLITTSMENFEKLKLGSEKVCWYQWCFTGRASLLLLVLAVLWLHPVLDLSPLPVLDPWLLHGPVQLHLLVAAQCHLAEHAQTHLKLRLRLLERPYKRWSSPIEKALVNKKTSTWIAQQMLRRRALSLLSSLLPGVLFLPVL